MSNEQRTPQVPVWKKAIVNAYFKFMKLEPERAKDELNFALNIVSKSHNLQLCDPNSILEAVVNISTYKVTLNPSLRMAYLIARQGWCYLEPSYMGLIAHLKESGSIIDISAYVVYEDEEFLEDPIGGKIIHKINYPKDEKEQDARKIKVAYSRALLPSGHVVFEVVPYWELEKIRKLSKSKSYEEWGTEMYKKTAIRRHFKTLLTISGSKNKMATKILELEDNNFEQLKKNSNEKTSLSNSFLDVEEVQVQNIEELVKKVEQQEKNQPQLTNTINEESKIKNTKQVEKIEAKSINPESIKAKGIVSVNEETNPILPEPSEIYESSIPTNKNKVEPIENVENFIPDFGKKRETVAELFEEKKEEQIVFDLTQTMNEVDSQQAPPPNSEDEYDSLLNALNNI